jgi:hypothetical protein
MSYKNYCYIPPSCKQNSNVLNIYNNSSSSSGTGSTGPRGPTGQSGSLNPVVSQSGYSGNILFLQNNIVVLISSVLTIKI